MKSFTGGAFEPTVTPESPPPALDATGLETTSGSLGFSPSRRWRVAALAGAAVAAVAVLGVGGWWALRGPKKRSTPSGGVKPGAPARPGMTTPEPDEGTRTAPPGEARARAGTRARVEKPSAETRQARKDRPRAPRQVTVTFSSQPRGAEVYLGKKRVARTPKVLKLRSSTKPVTFTFKKKGRRAVMRTVVLNRNQKVTAKLPAARRPPRRTMRPASSSGFKVNP